jgi:hypothetical protein
MKTAYTKAIGREHWIYINSAHTMLQITDIKVKQLQSQCGPLNP